MNSQTPYTPDLVPSDYLLSRPLKEASCGSRFATDDEVKDGVLMWLRSQPKTFFADGIRRLVNLYTIYVLNMGDIIFRNDILCFGQRLLYTG